MTNVALVEDHEMVIEGLTALLTSDDRFNVVGTATTVERFRAAIGSWDADVVIADYRLPDGKGTELVTHTKAPVLLISGTVGPGVIKDAVQAGCAGFVGKHQSVRDLADNVAIVANGGSVFPADELRRLNDPARAAHASLTARELEVLRELAVARTVPEIARDFHLSQHTVRNHVRSLLCKLQARSQLEAIVNAVRAGLVELED